MAAITALNAGYFSGAALLKVVVTIAAKTIFASHRFMEMKADVKNF